MHRGYIRLWRKTLESPVWSNSTPEHRVVLVTLLTMVNWEPKKWEFCGEKYACNPGQVVTSLSKITELSGKGVTTQNVRSALKRFEKLGFLTSLATKTGRLISIIKWGTYQHDAFISNKGTNKELTKSQQRANKELTPTKELKELKELKTADFQGEDQTLKIKRIVDFLSLKTNQRFSAALYTTQVAISTILMNYTETEVKNTIQHKVNEWGGSDKMRKHLNPGTLFAIDKFEKYYNEATAEDIQYKPPPKIDINPPTSPAMLARQEELMACAGGDNGR